MTAETQARTQQKLLLAIAWFTRKHGYAPSMRDLAAACDLSSTSVVRWHLEALRGRGMVTWTPRVARSVRLVHKGGAA